MRMVKLLAVLVMVLGGWTAYGETTYEYYIHCVTAQQTKPTKIEIPVFSSDLSGDGRVDVSIEGQLHVKGSEMCPQYDGSAFFPTREAMINYVREHYCTESNWPVGEVFFTHNELNHKISLGIGSIDNKAMNYFELSIEYLYKIIRDGEWDGEGGGTTIRCVLPSLLNN